MLPYRPQQSPKHHSPLHIRRPIPSRSRTQSPSIQCIEIPHTGDDGMTSPVTVVSRGWSTPQPRSPYDFVPIKEERNTAGRYTPPVYQKNGTTSPSMRSLVTEDTVSESWGDDSFGMMRWNSSPANSTFRASPRLKSPLGKKSPFKQVATATSTDDELNRKTRIKTEMCIHYMNGKMCPFGSECTYAHGEEELQMTKLWDLHEAGLVDKETYRIKPCFTWISTGSCPFGKRCTSIHDPRVGGTYHSWLPQTETQGNTMATDINVEALNQKRQNHILMGHPFGHQFSMVNENWSEYYKLVCNINYVKNGWVDGRRQKKAVPPIVKLQIALQMRGSSPEWQYKYRPQHVVYEELCMVLQKRAFSVKNLVVNEIPISDYRSHKDEHILVREIAFGPDEDPTVRGVALWFNIDEASVGMCTPQQAKRFRWKRSLKREDNDRPVKPSAFDSIDHFTMIRSHDGDAFYLGTDMLKHRLDVLQTELMSNMKDRYESLKLLDEKKEQLKERFELQKQHWLRWEWPVNKGREITDKKTPVPSIDSEYQLNDVDGPTNTIWKGFVDMKYQDSDSSTSHGLPMIPNLDCVETAAEPKSEPSRLPIFTQLSLGLQVSEDRSLPHINRTYKGSTHRDPLPRQQARCWVSLLIDEGDKMNEWNVVREHFIKARTNKILTIIQK
ncbi:hypothetical protein FisN_23Lh026 [Fistulifera solaris]|uniref:C3H1-type domain-containing protein n=1 Tax=Fistulifera solaris TaxID=1519565 RepID=A0A1Z5KKE2_FISSO|nr:hypothetical protein FisN_23Lh026 [Fistulifera solaris]|eukprot:GAX26501.1 hypothetical protein FisN_23Lh026 [Fistulifera solaris]